MDLWLGSVASELAAFQRTGEPDVVEFNEAVILGKFESSVVIVRSGFAAPGPIRHLVDRRLSLLWFAFHSSLKHLRRGLILSWDWSGSQRSPRSHGPGGPLAAHHHCGP